MKAILLTGPASHGETAPGPIQESIGEIVLSEVDAPPCGPGEVLVRPLLCGICGTDYDAVRFDRQGRSLFGGSLSLPVVLGHEISGVVEEVGPGVRRVQKGQYVALESIIACGECRTCLAGRRNQCEAVELLGLTRAGGLAELVAVPATACHSLDPLRAVMSTENVLAAGALMEPLAGAYNAVFVEGGGVRPGSSVVVYGLGPIGVFAGVLARLAGAAQVLGVDPIEERGRWARSVGFDGVLTATAQDSLSMLADRLPAKGADFQVEATGAPEAVMPVAEQLLTAGAVVVVLSRTRKRTSIDTNFWVSAAARLIGSRGHAGQDVYPKLITLFARSALKPEDFVGAYKSLTDAADVLRYARNNEVGKTMIRVN